MFSEVIRVVTSSPIGVIGEIVFCASGRDILCNVVSLVRSFVVEGFCNFE